MSQTVKQFVTDAYQLISANSPTVPLQGNDMLKGVQFLNELIQSYSGTGLMTTISKEISYQLSIGQSEITFADPDYTPAADVQEGRLANTQNVYLLLENVTYPLIIQNRNSFLSSYKFDPQIGLPRFAIIYNEVDVTRMRIYPGASQAYELRVYGKFELPEYTENDDLSNLPLYYNRYLKFALARDLAMYKGRAEAWTDKLELMYVQAKMDMESVSTTNLVIETENESLLNGAYRVRAGV